MISQSNKNSFWYWMFFWLIVQSIVAFNAELFHDEAYYWMYSKYPDWGYFDHPPLVAMLIKIGNFINLGGGGTTHLFDFKFFYNIAFV